MAVSSLRLPRMGWIPLGIVLFVLLSGISPGLSAPPGAATVGTAATVSGGEVLSVPLAAPPVTNVTLTVNVSSVNLSSQFWGTTVNNEVRMFRGETNAVNATPGPGARLAGRDGR